MKTLRRVWICEVSNAHGIILVQNELEEGEKMGG
jgi:hypothetical protein